MNAIVELTGKSFGRLTVLGRSPRKSAAGAMWLCRCECGNETHVASQKLRDGKTVSCGCYRREQSGNLNLRHGLSNKSRTYKSWKEMRRRCTSKTADQYKWYGGRGIKVCDRWNDYELFLEDMGDRPEGMTLDRINNDGDYEPENCCWATHKEQTRKQTTNKLSEDLAAQLRDDRASGMTYRALGQKYGISRTSAHRCASGITWS